MRLRLIYFLPLLFLSCFQTRVTQLEAPLVQSLNDKDLNASLSAFMDSSRFIGLGLGLIKEGEIEFADGFGFADVKEQISYSAKHVQPIGSVSKLFIGLAVAKSIEQGYFNLDTEINSILPFEINHPSFPDQPITIFHLVTHTSGIIDGENYWANNYFIKDTSASDDGTQYLLENFNAIEGEPESIADFMRYYFKPDEKWYAKENFNSDAPGAAYEYSNIGSCLAAYLVEIKSGMSFEEYCQKHFFDVLKMDATYWQVAKAGFPKSTLYKNKETAIPEFKLATFPDGGLHTNVNDLLLFMQEMMLVYNEESNLFNTSTSRLMMDKKFEVPPENLSKETNSGIFWDWMKNGRVGHNGADPGLFTMLSMNPETNSGYIMLFNKDMLSEEDWKKDYKQFLKLEKYLIELGY